MDKLHLDNFVQQYETIEELISFEDKIGRITGDTRKNINENYSLDIKNYLSSIEKLVQEHKNNLINITMQHYEDYRNSV